MWAARRGNLEVCRLLIDTGCKIDTTEHGGRTALMWAAMEGHLEVCRLIIDTGCKIDTTACGGYTALLWAALYGHLEVCRLFIDSGCKIDTTESSGKTALHLATEDGHIQVARYLVEQGGISPLIETHEGKTPFDLAAANLQVFPRNTKVMEYLQSLMSKDGIDFSLKNPEKIQETPTVEDEVPTEIKSMTDKRSVKLYLELLESGSEKKRDIRLVVVGKKGAGKTSLIKRLFGEDITDVTSTNGIEIHKIKCKAKSNDGIWNKLDDLFKLWMDSIHCYSRLEEDRNKSDVNEKTSDDLDPPIVIVGTWKDDLVCAVEEIDDACRENILKYTENMSDDELGHIRQEYFISNTEDDPSVFRQIRENILNLARKMKTWNKDYPLKFIQLEKRLHEQKKELPIISLQEIQNIAFDTPQPLNDEELRVFLEFHHDIRALVYFKDIPSFIVLDTQWLSDAFKCIVTAKKFRAISIRNKNKWNELYSRGKLYSEVLDDIFKKGENIFSKHKDHILNVMEKFDIIIRPNTSETQREAGDDKPLYYLPCMIKSEPECDVYEMFKVTENKGTKSTWLCYMFKFLPPHLMNHLIASLCRKYNIAEVVTKEQKRQIALFRGSAVFELEKATKLRKLLIMKGPNVIQIQVWQFEKQVERGLFKYIADFVTVEIIKLISKRFKMSNVRFELKWECGQTKPECVTGSFDLSEDQEKKYYCETCTTTHTFTGEWSDLQHKTSDSSENVPRSNLYIENSSQTQTTVQSTKVHVRVQAGERVFSNVNERATGAVISAGFIKLKGIRNGYKQLQDCTTVQSPTMRKTHTVKRISYLQFTKEEINFTKMGMIALNILADVLYDLLKPDKPHLRQRCDCDITYLYSEHRKLNKHIPSNSNHRRCPPGPWGGNWLDIQNTDIAIGDDIERIRLTRNELQHSQIFKLDEIRFNELCNILSDLLNRFDNQNKPTRLYTDGLNEILAKTISADEAKSIENSILGMTIEVEIDH